MKRTVFSDLRSYMPLPLRDKSTDQDKYSTQHTEHELQDHSDFARSLSPDVVVDDDDSGDVISKTDATVTPSELHGHSLPLKVSAGKVNTGYRPLFTRRWILICSAVFWILIGISLQVIYSVSQAHNGLATTTLSLHYIWTYGPTAVLIVVTIVWRQVDYAAKYIQPWAALARGPLPAEQTLLLNYVTDFQVVALWRALRLQHLTVASSILIFVLVKVLTVISTGLFNLVPTPFDGVPQQMQTKTVFSGSGGLPLDQIDSRPAVTLYGHSQYGMLLPNGTSENFAYQIFEPSGGATYTADAYNASVDVFMADGWNCEIGVLTSEVGIDVDSDGDFQWEQTPVSTYFNTTISLPDCKIYHGHLDSPDWYYGDNDTSANYGYWGTFQRVNCSNLDQSDPGFRRYSVAVAYSKGTGDNTNTLLNSSNVVCRPSYKVQPAYVTVFINGSVSDSIVFHGNPRQLDNITADDVAEAVWSSLREASFPTPFDPSYIVIDSFMANMVRLTPDFATEMLMDTTWLAGKSFEVYQQNAVQVAALYLLPANDAITIVPGTITQTVQRLSVRHIPIRLMQTCAAAMLILTVSMIVTIPQNVVPRPIESVAAIAIILARSPSLVKLLKNTGHLSLDELKCKLVGQRFMSTIADSPDGRVFSILVVSNPEPDVPPTVQEEIKWSRPLILRRVAMVLILCFALAVLIALETVYRKTQTNQGLTNVSSDSLQQYIWVYAPTVVLVLLATTFNILDFELEFADPYHELARGYANASSSLLWDPLRNVTFQTLFHAFRYGRFALVASSISVMLAPFLTIIVSGLFVASEVPNQQNIMVSAQTWFNLSSNAAVLEPYFTLPSLILQRNMSYPQWTYDELAFPSIDLSSPSLKIENVTSGSLSIDTPAVRASMNCTRIPESSFFNFTYPSSSGGTNNSIFYNISTPNGCGNSAFYEGSNPLTFEDSMHPPASGSGFFGVFGNAIGETILPATNESFLCPDWIAVFGKLSASQVESYKVFWCSSGFETVQTTSTFTMSRQTVTSIQSIDESSAKVFNPNWIPPDGGPYFIPVDLVHSDESFDTFVTTMIYGLDGVPREQLLADPDSSTTDASTDPFVQQLTHTYRQWTAQWANLYMRDTTANLATNTSNIAGPLPTTLSAEYIDPTRQRLFLNQVSVRILQGIIGCLLLCGITILILVDMSRVLPKKVGSIAAVASLLASSKLVGEGDGNGSRLISEGMEWLSDGEITRRGLWKGEKFRMGWWDEYEYGEGEGEAGKTGGTGYNAHEYEMGMGEVGGMEKRKVFGIDVVRRGVE